MSRRKKRRKFADVVQKDCNTQRTQVKLYIETVGGTEKELLYEDRPSGFLPGDKDHRFLV